MPSTNRLIGQSYDANGNAQFNGTSYDGENRLLTRTMTEGTLPDQTYQYDPSGKRVSKYNSDGAGNYTWEFYFYDITGREGAAITPSVCPGTGGQGQVPPFCPNARLDTYFGGQRVQAQGQWIVSDRVGTVRASFTYPSWNPNKLSFPCQ